jgi:hypothetical protein
VEGRGRLALVRRALHRHGRALARAWRRWRRRWRWARRQLRAMPRWAQALVLASAAVVVLAAANLVYQVVRKPTEMFFPVAGALDKAPAATWRDYAPAFRGNATAAVTPELLAALAQVEGAGNPVARTYWRWRFSWNPFAIYRPASSAVGMYQMTDGAFAEARRYCIHHHQVTAEGPWWDWHSCWFNALYFRVLPSHAVELTAVYLDRHIAAILAPRSGPPPTTQQAEDLAALVHLCGGGVAEAYARAGFRLAEGERCGDHDPALYLAEVRGLARYFRRLAEE